MTPWNSLTASNSEFSDTSSSQKPIGAPPAWDSSFQTDALPDYNVTNDIHAHYYVKSPAFTGQNGVETKNSASAAAKKRSKKRPASSASTMKPSLMRNGNHAPNKSVHTLQSAARPASRAQIERQSNGNHAAPDEPIRKSSALRNKLRLPQRSSSAMAVSSSGLYQQDHDSAPPLNHTTGSVVTPHHHPTLTNAASFPRFETPHNASNTHHSPLYKNNYVTGTPNSPQVRDRVQSIPLSSLSLESGQTIAQTAYDVLFDKVKNPMNASKKKKQKSSKKASSNTIKSKSGKKKSTKTKGSKKSKKTRQVNEQKMSMDESSALIYEKSKERILRLWEELRIPHNERLQFAEKYFHIEHDSINKKTLTKLSRYMEKLMQHRQNTLHVLKRIDIRESYLQQLEELVEAYEERNILNYAALSQQVVQLISKIRLATLDTVEAIIEWRQGLTVPKPFLWKTKNYLLKVQSDLDFFKQSSLSTLVEGSSEQDTSNQDTTEHGNGAEDSHSENIQDAATVKTQRQNGNLPPLKLGTPGKQNKTVPERQFLQRIQNAAQVITNESNLTETVMDQLQSSNGKIIPTLKDVNTPTTARNQRADSIHADELSPITSTGRSSDPEILQTTKKLPASKKLAKLKAKKSRVGKKVGKKSKKSSPSSSPQRSKRRSSKIQPITAEKKKIKKQREKDASHASQNAPRQEIPPSRTTAATHSAAGFTDGFEWSEEVHSPISETLSDFERPSYYDNSATVIQAAFRGFLARKRFYLLKQSDDLCNECALRIQLAWRAYVARKVLDKKLQEQYEESRREYKEASITEEEYNSRKTKSQFLQRRIENAISNDKAIIIQNAWRQSKKRRDAESDLQHQLECVILTQTAYRTREAQRHYEKSFTEQLQSATAIQSTFRGYKERKQIAPRLDPIRDARHQAALNIQRVYRGHTSRQETEQWIFERERAIGVIVPAVKQYLACLKVNRLRDAHEKEIEEELKQEKAALQIQRMARGHSGRKAAQHERKRHASATKIQSKLRAWQSNKRTRALREQQENDLEQFLQQERATLALQSHFRRVLSKRFFNHLKLTKNAAATDIQRIYRSHLARKFVSKWKSAIRLQTNVRGFLARRTAQRIRAARKIEAVALGWLARRRYPQLREAYYQRLLQELEMEQSVWTIQRAARLFLAKKHAFEEKKRQTEELLLYERQEKAVLEIQRFVKGHLARCRVHRIKFEAPLHTAAVVIQTAARVFLAKNRTLFLRAEKSRLEHERKQQDEPLHKLQTVSAIQIQRAARGYLARQQVRRFHYDQAALVIQKAAQSWIHHLHTQRANAATSIQKNMRGHLARKHYSVMKREKNNAATLIQKEARVWLAKRFVEKTRAAIEIQRVMRGKLGRNKAQKQKLFNIQNAAALRIQTQARQFLAKCFVHRWRSACVIQRSYRVHCAKKRVEWLRQLRDEQIQQEREQAATHIQKIVRGHLSRRFVANYRVKANEAALTIQGRARIYLAKKTVKKERAARVVQGCVKQFIARSRATRRRKIQERRIDNIIRRELAARTLQKVFRGYLVRKKLLRSRRANSKEYMATRIQCCARVFLARKHAQHLKDIYEEELRDTLQKEHAALMIQRNVRVRQAKTFTNQYRIDRKEFEASRTIQTQARVFLAKKHVNHMKRIRKHSLKQMVQEELATIEIQRMARGFLARNRVSALVREVRSLKKNNQAASQIQAAWNGFLDRKDVAAMHRSLILVQACMRSIIAQHKIGSRENATRTLQAFYRGYVVRKELWRHQRAARCITRAARAHLAYKARNATVIQAAVRSHLSRKHRKEQCIVFIQSQIRSFLQQLRYNELLMNIAAIVIQRNFKAFHVRSMAKSYVSELKDENRTSVNGAIVREYAALTIQCAWRQRMARKVVSQQTHKHDSATTLQCAWRSYHARKMRIQLEDRTRKVILVQNRIRQILGYLSFNDRLALDVLDFADSLIGEQQESIKLQSIIKIQRAARPFIARRILERRRQEKREELHRRITQEWYSSHHHIDSVVLVQRCARRVLAAVDIAHERELMTRKNESALTIQLAFKSHKARRTYKVAQRQKRRQLEFEKRQLGSTLFVQNVIRQLQSQVKTREFYRVFLITQVQRMVLAQLARRDTGILKSHVESEKRQILREVSASLIQRNYKVFKAREELSYRRQLKEQKEARTLDNARSLLLAKRASKVAQAQEPDLQPLPIADDARDSAAGDAEMELYLKKEQVATHMKSLESTAALRIQCMIRRYHSYNQLQKQREEYYEFIEKEVQRDIRESSALTIQRAVRFAQAQQIVKMRALEVEEEEALELEREMAEYRT